MIPFFALIFFKRKLSISFASLSHTLLVVCNAKYDQLPVWSFWISNFQSVGFSINNNVQNKLKLESGNRES